MFCVFLLYGTAGFVLFVCLARDFFAFYFLLILWFFGETMERSIMMAVHGGGDGGGRGKAFGVLSVF